MLRIINGFVQLGLIGGIEGRCICETQVD